MIGTGFGDQKTRDSSNLSCVFVWPWCESSSDAIYFFFRSENRPWAMDDSTRVSACCHLPLYCCGCCKLKIHFRIGGTEIQHKHSSRHWIWWKATPFPLIHTVAYSSIQLSQRRSVVCWRLSLTSRDWGFDVYFPVPRHRPHVLSIWRWSMR